MKVIATQSAVLTNYEVLQHLNDVRRRYADHPDYNRPQKDDDTRGHNKTTRGRLNEFRDLIEDVHRYLTIAGPLSKEGATYNEGSYRRLLQRLEKFKLTKPELINIINIRPQVDATLYLCIEEAEQRYNDAEQEEMLAIIAEELGTDPEADGAGNGEETVGGQAMDVDEETAQ